VVTRLKVSNSQCRLACVRARVADQALEDCRARQRAAQRAGRPIPADRRAGGDLAVVVSLIGARSDPQGLAAQATALAQAGAHVFASNAQAARFACDLIAAS
jgi:hypothetical protein